jgi:hypothetical protein
MHFRNRENNPLFSEGDLSATLQLQVEKLRTEIDGLASDYVLKVSFDDLTSHLTDKFHIEPISLLKDEIHVGNSGDTTVNMSHDFRYGGGATHVPATFAEFVIPFTGDTTSSRNNCAVSVHFFNFAINSVVFIVSALFLHRIFYQKLMEFKEN